MAFHVHAARVSVSWTAPTTSQDGTSLNDLAGYKVFYGLATRSYDVAVDVGLNTSAVLSDLEAGRTYFFAVTAYDASGNESVFSVEEAYTIPLPDTGNGDNACGFPNLALCATASASSVWSAGYEATQATDGNGGTRWNSANGETAGAWLALDFGALATFDTIVLKEAITRITGYRLQYWDGSTWRDILSGNSIGATKTHTFAALTAQWVRLYVTSTVSGGSSGTPTIYEFEVYQ